MKVSKETSQLRKQYAPPRLIEYGSIRELTKSGSVKKNENQGGGIDKYG
ncbi:MAG: lasso RiPP family leader peptide-containing protein [Chloroflexi bacterium]|nr:lasso RiPP family leader peptide-containing protein [Chloroflexota bacterium]